MNEMIERVAKAIALRDTTDEFAMAREAIKAIKEQFEKQAGDYENAIEDLNEALNSN